MDSTLLWTLLGSIAAILAVLLAAWQVRLQVGESARQEKAERERLTNEVFGEKSVSAQSATNSAEGTEQQKEPPPHEQALSPEVAASSRDAVYDQLLINDYALGLTQARRAFNVSMTFSILGGLVLIIGVALAIFRADTGGQVAGAAITSAAGVLTSGLSQLFRGQSTKALKHLESQAVELRKDVRAQINAATAQRLLGEIADVELRSRLQAALILEFTGARLPDFGKPSQPQQGNLDGGLRNHEFTERSSSSS